jgi:hypothetical protein
LDHIPASFYAILGFLIVANLSTLGALVIFIFKVGVFVSATETGIAEAHRRIDKVETRVNTLEQYI